MSTASKSSNILGSAAKSIFENTKSSIGGFGRGDGGDGGAGGFVVEPFLAASAKVALVCFEVVGDSELENILKLRC